MRQERPGRRSVGGPGHRRPQSRRRAAPHGGGSDGAGPAAEPRRDRGAAACAGGAKPVQRASAPAVAEPQAATAATGVQTLAVQADEAGMRVDRFLIARFPQLAFTHIQRIVRKGELRVNGKRVKPNDRLQAGQKVRVPPLKLAEPRVISSESGEHAKARDFLSSITLYEDADVLVLNKPMGLAVQGGSGTKRHVDGLLEAMRDDDGQRPRLVHRLDKDTSGCLVVAKTRFAATTLAKTFRSRSARKIYWAVVAGVPRVPQGRISSYLAKEDESETGRVRVARHGDDGASHALTYYAVIDQAAQKIAWLSLKPVTGRTHQLRAHAAHIGHPIIGDPKYFNVENWELPGGIQNRLHLLARRIVVAHPRTGRPIDVTAPLPPHMRQTFNLLGFETARYDPVLDAPEE
jgi:23S rRNA pseudouridine955/2504/2580 synthase